MGKTHVNARLEESVIEALDAYAEAHGMTRTAALERLVMDGIKASDEAASERRRAAQEATEDEERVETHSDSLRAVIDVLRASNADLRAEVSRLWAQMGEKDRQIARAHELADQSHRMHAAEIVKTLPTEAEGAKSMWQRLASVFYRKGE